MYINVLPKSTVFSKIEIEVRRERLKTEPQHQQYECGRCGLEL